MKPCSCGKFRHMCPSCKTAYFSESKQTIDMCKCKSAKFQPQCCPKCSDGHGNPRVDWDKPIQCRTIEGRILPLKYVGRHLGGTIVDFGNPTTGTSSLHYAEKVTLGTIENVPEPKPEKWINVYWNKTSELIENSVYFSSKDIAENWSTKGSPYRKLLGTFRVE